MNTIETVDFKAVMENLMIEACAEQDKFNHDLPGQDWLNEPFDFTHKDPVYTGRHYTGKQWQYLMTRVAKAMTAEENQLYSKIMADGHDIDCISPIVIVRVMAVCRREGIFTIDKQVARFWELCGYMRKRNGRGKEFICQAPMLGAPMQSAKSKNDKPFY